MKMTTRAAFNNMKYYKSKNILAGVAIILTTLLLFVVPTVGKGIMDVQFAAVNKIYPAWHALYRNVDESTAKKLEAHHDIETYGLRSDVGYMALEDASASMIYMDEKAMELSKVEIAEGRAPGQEDEIVVSKGLLEELGQPGKIGDTITVPYQIYRDGGLDYTQEKEFRICGFFEDSKAGREQRIYVSLISKEFLDSELGKEGAVYRFLFQIKDLDVTTTEQIENKIKGIAEKFGISEDNMNINEEYLGANYVDPVMLPAIMVIMLVIIVAGIITIYSIYYVSMNQRVQEFGRLKAIGATRRQVRQIVLREGLCVAAIAIPVGLLIGTFASRLVLMRFVGFADGENTLMKVVKEIIQNREVPLLYWWIYLLTIAVTLCTVYLSLLKPMRTASKVSEVEAMRYQGGGGKQKSSRKGYTYLTIGRLTRRNLAGDKKKSVITIAAMAVTGMFLMIVATVLSCANPAESTKNSIIGQYEISPIIESGNKEHPEREWSEVQKNNPLNEDLKKQIEALDGVIRVDTFSTVRVSGGPFKEEMGDESINGIPEEYAKELEKGIVEGKVSYEELKSGDKVIVDYALLRWYPDLKVGDKMNLTIHDGDRIFEKEIEIAAVGEYGSGMSNYNYLFMAKEAADKLCSNNASSYFHVIADKNYDKNLESALSNLVKQSGRIRMRTWKEVYEQWDTGLAMTSTACYAFLGILAVISVMNLVNTMINSVHVRKKELGMMQAIGMSGRQLMKMLQYEGLFYTAGTLLVSVGLGSLAGYPVFLYAKRTGIFDISTYHYPVAAAVIISVTLLAVQMLLAVMIAKSVKKDSLIERIRFSE